MQHKSENFTRVFRFSPLGCYMGPVVGICTLVGVGGFPCVICFRDSLGRLAGSVRGRRLAALPSLLAAARSVSCAAASGFASPASSLLIFPCDSFDFFFTHLARFLFFRSASALGGFGTSWALWIYAGGLRCGDRAPAAQVDVAFIYFIPTTCDRVLAASWR